MLMSSIALQKKIMSKIALLSRSSSTGVSIQKDMDVKPGGAEYIISWINTCARTNNIHQIMWLWMIIFVLWTKDSAK